MERLFLNIDSKIRNLNNYPNSSYFKIDKNIDLKNIDYIKLVSFELVNNFYVFTNGRHNISFIIKYNSVDYTITISERNYTISELLTEINDKITSVIGNNICTFVNNNNTNIITLNKITVSTLEIDFSNVGTLNDTYKSLGYFLGFRKNNYIVEEDFNAETQHNVLGDNYLFIKVNDYGNLYIQPNLPIKVFSKIIFKKPVDNLVYKIQPNFYSFKAPININKIEIELIDIFGNRLDIGNIDYSLTVELGQVSNCNNYDKNMLNTLNLLL